MLSCRNKMWVFDDTVFFLLTVVGLFLRVLIASCLLFFSRTHCAAYRITKKLTAVRDISTDVRGDSTDGATAMSDGMFFSACRSRRNESAISSVKKETKNAPHNLARYQRLGSVRVKKRTTVFYSRPIEVFCMRALILLESNFNVCKKCNTL